MTRSLCFVALPIEFPLVSDMCIQSSSQEFRIKSERNNNLIPFYHSPLMMEKLMNHSFAKVYTKIRERHQEFLQYVIDLMAESPRTHISLADRHCQTHSV